MYLNPGMKDEYKRRHDKIQTEWKGLHLALKNSGIKDYSIFYDDQTGILFATLWRRTDHTMDKLPEDENV